MIQPMIRQKLACSNQSPRRVGSYILFALLLFAPKPGHAKDPCAGLEGKDLRECNKTGGGGGLSIKDAKVVMTGVDAIDSVVIPVAEMLEARNNA